MVGTEDVKTQTSSETADEFLSAQGSTTSEPAVELQDSTSNVTEVSELSEDAGINTVFTTPKKGRSAQKYFSVAIGRKPGIYNSIAVLKVNH